MKEPEMDKECERRLNKILPCMYDYVDLYAKTKGSEIAIIEYDTGEMVAWKDFATKSKAFAAKLLSLGIKKGDIVVVGKNFGCGSSRQQAVDCFKSLGVSLILAESFGAIYERNAINNAMPILSAEGIVKKIKNDDLVSVKFESGDIEDKTQGKTYKTKPFSKVQREIYQRGGLLTG